MVWNILTAKSECPLIAHVNAIKAGYPGPWLPPKCGVQAWLPISDIETPHPLKMFSATSLYAWPSPPDSGK